ncbi:hypothetical protein CWI75_02825 [Kineobactrum sediminis]|uniref:DUF5666 domain-containing protein n=1 Tax=Kineobactrum sediminis TaxID=1905677 RepID=A0A2N5Y7B6_9GAMM|nr:hypothetical protein [Kineobactrum sediminis]PLW84291.1 hypothetical protein CWI75_02825 [Kineobactrum sediminis]
MNRKKLAILLSGVLLGAPAWSQNPYLQPDDTWIEISGTVTSVTPDSFMLDYGDGTITVEMDDGDRDADAYKLYEGDKVTVSGMVDDDLFETTTIEASSVFVENLGTTFYASAVDEEDPMAVSYFAVPIVPSSGVLQGTVTSVDEDEEEFNLNTGLRMITVEVDEMPYNPLDDEGYQKINSGDQVRVTGTLDNDLFEGRVFEADYVTTLFRD